MRENGELFRVRDAVYSLVMENNAGADAPVKQLGENVFKYVSACPNKMFDIAGTLCAGRGEFIQMAYFGILGQMPDEDMQEQMIKSCENMGEDDFRAYVISSVSNKPQAVLKNTIIRNNIYGCANNGRENGTTLKQKIIFGGYQLGRKLPNWIKSPIKKIVIYFLTKK